MEKVAILIPAHNEEKVIAATIHSLLRSIEAKHIYVVDDGSVDRTGQVARSFGVNVLKNAKNLGKANSSNIAIKYFNLTDRYEYILPMDSDTTVSPHFLFYTTKILDEDYQGSICAVVGKVLGKNNGWITAYRLWEYEVAQAIHKSAQSVESAIVVCPGCSTLYRSKVFKYLQFPNRTLTEDMDFTFLLHRANIGKIVYCDKATVRTQDPKSLRDYVKQVDRWYTGFWQCVLANNIPWGGQTLDLEVAMLALEGIFNSFLVLALIFLIPKVLSIEPMLLVIPVLFDLCFFLLPTLIFTAHKHSEYKILLHLPQFYLMRAISSIIFMISFFKVVVSYDLRMGWNKATRYEIK